MKRCQGVGATAAAPKARNRCTRRTAVSRGAWRREGRGQSHQRPALGRRGHGRRPEWGLERKLGVRCCSLARCSRGRGKVVGVGCCSGGCRHAWTRARIGALPWNIFKGLNAKCQILSESQWQCYVI